MTEHRTGSSLHRYFHGCAWPCSPDVARAIAADSGAPQALLLALELVPTRLYVSEEALLEALVGATLCPTVAYIGAAAGLATVVVERVNGQGRHDGERKENPRCDRPA